MKKSAPALVSPLDKRLPAPSEAGPSRPTPAPVRIIRALQVFEEEVGGREALVAELAQTTTPLDAREQQAIVLLADPGNDQRHLSDILGTAGLSVSSFLRLFREARGARAYLAALDKVWSRLPEVAMDVMNRALPLQKKCSVCHGTRFQPIPERKAKGSQGGKVPESQEDKKVVCTNCEGEGEITIAPTMDYQKLALQLGGFLKSGPTIQVDQSRTQNLQQNYLAINHTMRSHIAATNRVLYGDAHEAESAPIEAETVPPPAQAPTEPES